MVYEKLIEYIKTINHEFDNDKHCKRCVYIRDDIEFRKRDQTTTGSGWYKLKYSAHQKMTWCSGCKELAEYITPYFWGKNESCRLMEA